MRTPLVTDNLPPDRRTDFPLESTYVCVYTPHLQSGYCTADLTHDDVLPREVREMDRDLSSSPKSRKGGRKRGRAEWAGGLSDTNHSEEFPMCRTSSSSAMGGSWNWYMQEQSCDSRQGSAADHTTYVTTGETFGMVGLHSVADRPLVVPELSLSDSSGCMSCNITNEAFVTFLEGGHGATYHLSASLVVPCIGCAAIYHFSSLVVPQWFFGLCVVLYSNSI